MRELEDDLGVDLGVGRDGEGTSEKPNGGRQRRTRQGERRGRRGHGDCLGVRNHHLVSGVFTCNPVPCRLPPVAVQALQRELAEARELIADLQDELQFLR